MISLAILSSTVLANFVANFLAPTGRVKLELEL